jgi:predicted PurR-regulated permease PerM
LPVLLILLGILGGAIAFGFVGIFLGPTLLAIAHSLIRDWGSPYAGAALHASPLQPAETMGRPPVAPPHSEVAP